MTIHELGRTIILESDDFIFSYTPADDVVKDEFKGQYSYFGGLQCNFDMNDRNYNTLEDLLVNIAESIITIQGIKTKTN